MKLQERYQLFEIIGKGGNSVVYRALDESLHIEVAIKCIAQAKEHAQKEARCMAKLSHSAIPHIYDDDEEFGIGKANQLKEGKFVAIIANGDTVRLALDAAKELEAKGITARVLDMHTIKPLDTEAVTACINEIGKVITVEDHNILNGLGSAVCEVAAEMGKGIVKRIGVQDQYGQSAPYERLLAMNGITVENIVKTAEELQ